MPPTFGTDYDVVQAIMAGGKGERLHPLAAPRRQRQRLAARRAGPGELDPETGRGAGDQGDGAAHGVTASGWP